MILHMSYEEMQALSSGAELVVPIIPSDSRVVVTAPPEERTAVQGLRSRLTGDISVETLAEQREVETAVASICDTLHEQLDSTLLDHHPAHEEAVELYFSYAHARTILERVERMGDEMVGMIELMTGRPPTRRAAMEVAFPD